MQYIKPYVLKKIILRLLAQQMERNDSSLESNLSNCKL